MKFSTTIAGLIVAAAGTVLTKVGVSEQCSTELVSNAPQIWGNLLQGLGGIWAWMGRVKQGDVKWYGAKIKS